MRERLIRVLLLGVVILVIAIVAKALASGQGGVTTLPNLPIGEKIEELGEKVLGKAVQILPGAPDLGETVQEKEEGQVAGEADEAEPIKEPAENVQKQTEILIEAIKELPQDQIEAIKKQIYKEMCEGLLKEE